MNQGSFLDGRAGPAGRCHRWHRRGSLVILQSALASANVNNPEIHISKGTMSAKKEQQALMNNENREFPLRETGCREQKSAGFTFTPLRDSVKDIDAMFIPRQHWGPW